MGLFSKIKDKFTYVIAKRIGKGVSMGAVGRFLVQNKKTIMGVFTAIGSWVWLEGCGTILGFDILALLQHYISQNIICDAVGHWLIAIAFFLAGAGIQDPREWISNLPKNPETGGKKF